MDEKNLKIVLEDHQKFLRGEGGCKADLSGANLREADLRGADLRGANLDFSAFPLWCGGLHIKMDGRLLVQLLFHLLSCVKASDEVDIKKLLLTPEIIKLTNKFHREDVGRIEED